MGKYSAYFDDECARSGSQLEGKACEVGDTEEIKRLRTEPKSVDNHMALAAALSRQMRYVEAIEELSSALELCPESFEARRLRAGKYLATLQCDKAMGDMLLCADKGESVDMSYRMGLCCFFMGKLEEATKWFAVCYAAADDEMKIAAIYWDIMCFAKVGAESLLLRKYHSGMEVGHHTGYETATRLWAGDLTAKELSDLLSNETDDMDYAIEGYALACYYKKAGSEAAATRLIKGITERDSYWVCFAFLAAWQERWQSIKPRPTLF